jgi:hypothetical protein
MGENFSGSAPSAGCMSGLGNRGYVSFSEIGRYGSGKYLTPIGQLLSGKRICQSPRCQRERVWLNLGRTWAKADE